MKKSRAPRNRTLTLSDDELAMYRKSMRRVTSPVTFRSLNGRVVCGDLLDVTEHFPQGCVDLMIVDPPYNLSKNFHGVTFAKGSHEAYEAYLESWLPKLLPLLKPEASVYVCCDWQCSEVVRRVLERYLIVRNRITWQREKGRGSTRNWKNCTEDIWFATRGDNYYFDVDAVRIRKRVIAPYRGADGQPKDWTEGADGGKYRLTCASNFWDDITIPYWSMPENTDHPTQKSEKLIAKLILASSAANGVVFDPFLGSGTTAVVAKKLNRRFFGVELNELYCAYALKRLALVDENPAVQGYDGTFKERNAR